MAMTPTEALQGAIDAAGGRSQLATCIGGSVVRQHVEYWLKSGSVPAEHCPAIERETGVRCEALRPDVDWSVLRTAA